MANLTFDDMESLLASTFEGWDALSTPTDFWADGVEGPSQALSTPVADSVHDVDVVLQAAQPARPTAAAHTIAAHHNFQELQNTRPEFDGLLGEDVQSWVVRTVTPQSLRRNGYGSREDKINRELQALEREGKVSLSFGANGVGCDRRIASIFSTCWTEVIDRLNLSIASPGRKPGTASENLTQCLRDCGVVPRKHPGRTKGNWSKPAGGVWEFSEEAWQVRERRLLEQYAAVGKRKRGEDDQAPSTSDVPPQRRRRLTAQRASPSLSSSVAAMDVGDAASESSPDAASESSPADFLRWPSADFEEPAPSLFAASPSEECTDSPFPLDELGEL